jgi:hypothetical protein
MPAASAEKRARQRANKLLRMEAETTVTVSDSPPTAEIISEPLLSTPAPTSFTISYTPVSISYPEPINSTAQLPTDAIRVTRDQLSDMLHQSYIHGSEHLQEAYDRGYEHGMDECEAQLASLQESLVAKYEKQHLSMLVDFGERCQELQEAGIQEERERWESARLSKVNVTTQTDPATTSSIPVQTDSPITFIPTTTTTAVQTNPAIIPPTSSATISTQTEPPIPPVSESIPFPIPATISSASFNWSDNAALLSTIPIIPPKLPRDLSSLRSSLKNPFSSLRRRHHHSKYPQKHILSNRYTQPYPTHQTYRPLHHTPPILSNSLDWHRDPRLFELSRVLRTLGWSHH